MMDLVNEQRHKLNFGIQFKMMKTLNLNIRKSFLQLSFFANNV